MPVLRGALSECVLDSRLALGVRCSVSRLPGGWCVPAQRLQRLPLNPVGPHTFTRISQTPFSKLLSAFITQYTTLPIGLSLPFKVPRLLPDMFPFQVTHLIAFPQEMGFSVIISCCLCFLIHPFPPLSVCFLPLFRGSAALSLTSGSSGPGSEFSFLHVHN